jgi:glycosyltransferase involved in cell wall biosynthesis
VLADLAVRVTVKRSDRLIALSESVAQALRQVTTVPVDVIPLGRLVQTQAHTSAWNPDGPVVFFGRLSMYKGLDLLADAWATVADLPGAALQIFGEPSADQAVDAAIRTLQTLGAMVRASWVPDDEILSCLVGSRAVVLPYREASQSGIIPIALGLGIPVLATQVGALPEQVGDCGWIVSPSPEGLSSGLREVLIDRGAVRAAHEAAGRRFQQDEWDSIGQQVVRVCARTLEG